MKEAAQMNEETKPTTGQFIQAFLRGNREDLVSRIERAALGEMTFVGVDEIAVVRLWPEYRSDVIQRGENFFVKERLEFVVNNRKVIVRVIAAGSMQAADGVRVRGYLLKG